MLGLDEYIGHPDGHPKTAPVGLNSARRHVADGSAHGPATAGSAAIGAVSGVEACHSIDLSTTSARL